LSGAELRLLLARGEHDLLLQKRLARLAPEPRRRPWAG
jgi:hypothetical protein